MDRREWLELLMFLVFVSGSIGLVLYFRLVQRWERQERAKIQHEAYKSQLVAKDYYKKDKKIDYGKLIRVALNKYLKKE